MEPKRHLNNGAPSPQEDVVYFYSNIEAMTQQLTHPVFLDQEASQLGVPAVRRLAVGRMKGNTLFAQVAPKSRVWATCDQFLLKDNQVERNQRDVNKSY